MNAAMCVGGCAFLDGEGLSIFEQLPDRVGTAKSWGESVPGRRTCKFKGHDIELLSMSRDQVNVTRTEEAESHGG